MSEAGAVCNIAGRGEDGLGQSILHSGTPANLLMPAAAEAEVASRSEWMGGAVKAVPKGGRGGGLKDALEKEK